MMSLGADRYRPHKAKAPYKKCGRKVRYETIHEAERAARKCVEARGGTIRAYDCGVDGAGCGGFHLSAMPYRPSPKWGR
jgi:hypothetical protein